MSKKMRKLSIKPASQLNSDINVTPLIDIVLVMLIIFMVVTPLLEKNLDVRVPETEKVDTVTEVPPDQLVVRISADNKLRINFDEVSQEEYIDKLKARLDRYKKDTDKVVFFISDDKANYGRLVAAFDGAKQAGAKVLGMMTTPPEDEEKK
ncbi:MAG: biopolymer transporter ExbD [Polyangiaceae bacterium]|nr:biopolymer transporter ExbD [Polyangiaceae bacterium]